MDHLVFLTGRLAEPALRRVLGALAPAGDPAAPFTWEVREIGLQVAGLMTADLVARRVAPPVAATRVVVPGRCRGDLDALAVHLGVPVERGPDELKDLPQHFRRAAHPIPLDAPGWEIFAEIVDAPRLTVDEIVERAHAWAADGADVIDLGGLPDTPFPHLEDAVRALRAEGLRASVDSTDPQELLRGGRAGADTLLSLTEDTLWIADEVESRPVLVPRTPPDEASLWRAVEAMQRRGRPFLADAVLDPVPFGLLASLVRYQRLRERFPEAPLLLGTGNVTELMEADTSGITALLSGLGAELGIAAILTTQVSGHARRAIREADHARRIMHAAAAHAVLPKGLSDALMTVHAKHPFPDTPAEIAAQAAEVRDPNFRIQVAADGLHVYNRDGLRKATDAFALWPRLGVEDDAGHAFYLGAELARAEIAWRLGKRYVQDEPLDWGCATERAAEDRSRFAAPGTTMRVPRAARGHAGARPAGPDARDEAANDDEDAGDAGPSDTGGQADVAARGRGGER
jgi:dihydropteroate synthase